MAAIRKETQHPIRNYGSYFSITNNDILSDGRVRPFYIKTFCKMSICLHGIHRQTILNRKWTFSSDVLTNFHIQQWFSIEEAKKNKCVGIYHTHKHAEHHTKQTDISHHVCHNMARQIVGRKWSHCVRCQIQTEKSVASLVINKDRWFKQVRKMLVWDKHHRKRFPPSTWKKSDRLWVLRPQSGNLTC